MNCNGKKVSWEQIIYVVSVQTIKTADFPSENVTVSSSILTILFCNLREESSHFFVVCFSKILINSVVYFITTKSHVSPRCRLNAYSLNE